MLILPDSSGKVYRAGDRPTSASQTWYLAAMLVHAHVTLTLANLMGQGLIFFSVKMAPLSSLSCCGLWEMGVCLMFFL